MKKKYRVKKGDNFYSIAEKLYGNQAYAATLIWANPGIYVLHPGMILKTPQIDTSTGELPVMGNAAWERVKEGWWEMVAAKQHPDYEPPNMKKIAEEVFGDDYIDLPVPDEIGTAFVDPSREEPPEDFNPSLLLDERLQDKYLDKLVDVLYPEMPTTGKDGLREYPIMDEEWLTVDDKVKWREEMKERLREALFPDRTVEGPTLSWEEPDEDGAYATGKPGPSFGDLKGRPAEETETPPRIPVPTKEDPFFMSMIEESPDVLGLGGDETETDDSFVAPINKKAAAKKVLDAWLASVMDDKTLDYRTKQLAKEGYKRALMAIENGTYTLEDIQRIYGARVNTQPEEKEEKNPFINILGSIDLSNNPLFGPRPDLGGDVSTGGPKMFFKPADPEKQKEEAKAIVDAWKDNFEPEGLQPKMVAFYEKVYTEIYKGIDNGTISYDDVVMFFGKGLLMTAFNEGGVSTLPFAEQMTAEYFDLYWYGAPDDYRRDPVIVMHAGFGYEMEEWEDYYQRNTDGEIITKVAQYLVPGLMISEDARSKMLDDYGKDILFSTHNNLCGQLSVIAALGLGLTEGFDIFAFIDIYEMDARNNYKIEDTDRLISKGFHILNYAGYTTSFETLMTFIRKAGGSGVSSKHLKGDGSEESLRELLLGGIKPIALVNINTSDVGNGKLYPFSSPLKPTPHWVWVQDIITTKSGETLVRIYNPFMNREEVYTWEAFAAAWDTTGWENDNGVRKEQSGHFQLVTISYDE